MPTNAPLSTVLFADSDHTQRTLVRDSLAQSQFQVVEARDGAEILTMFDEVRPDLVLIDLLLHEVDGFKVCERLRARPGARKIPIVVIASLGDGESIRRAYHAGASDFITKPINSDTLQYQLNHLIGGDESTHAKPTSRQPILLVADDDPEDRSEACQAARNAGFRIVEADDGAAALDKFFKFSPDVLLIDVMMPKVDGYEVCSKLRSSPEGAHVPIIMATGLDDEESIEKAYELGATDFVTKPILPSLLRHRLRFVLRAGQGEERERDARQKAESANNAKSEFLARMSHELRTPINDIIGFSDALVSGDLSEDQAVYSKGINQSGRRVLDVISGVLDVSRLEAGRKSVCHEETDIATTIISCLDSIRDEADERGLDLRVRLDSKLGMIWTDGERVKQIVSNLLSNAMKFTPQGGRIELNADRKPPFIYVTVRDTGVGISKEDMLKVFEPFFQADSDAVRRNQGSGLGLSISRSLAQILAGDLFLKSRLSVGTEATLTIPVKLERGKTINPAVGRK